MFDKICYVVGQMNLAAKLGYGMKYFCDQDLLDVDYNIEKVMILSFKSCESLLFSNLFQRDCLFVLLEDKQKGKSGGIDIPWI